ncbi:hypothetical protein MJT46_001979 [Ovis ammon polii x Ovis aries]|nr:hypothetical protein MJT46_001979 [Ovis ammon polii x Ovis aries]
MAKWQEDPTRPPLPERARLLGDEMCQDAVWGTVEAGGREEGYCCCPGIQASLSTRLWPALCPTRVPLLPVARLLPCVSGVALGPSQREAPSKVSWPQDLQLHSLALVLSQPCTPTQQREPRLEIRFRASGARAARSRDTQTRTRPDRRTDRASGERGPGLPRGAGSDESPGGGEPALHPRRDRAGGVPGGERGVPAPPPCELGGPAPPPLRLSVGLSVGPRVCWSPGRPAPLSAGRPTFQRCPVPRPRRRLGFSIVGPRGRGSERRGPGAHGAGAPPPPPPRAPSLRRPHRSLAVPSAQSPALRSDPCPRRSPPAPRPPRPADPGSAATSPPRAGLCLSRSLPPPGSLSPRVAVSVSVALPVCSLPSSTPARSLPCVSLSLSVSLGSLSLSPSHSRCGPPRLRTQAPVACAASPARPPGSPSSRRPRRAENSQLAAPAPLCETFAPPHT